MSFAIIQCGLVGRERFATRAEAQEEVDRLNAEADEECGQEIVGDGAASVVEVDVDEDQDALSRAADHIDATELEDGRWAHYARETSRWYVVTAGELAQLCDYLDHEDWQIRRDAYSHWCAGSSALEMPADWEP